MPLTHRLAGLLLLSTLVVGALEARAQTIDTYAGGGVYVNTPALQAAVGYPASVASATDGSGAVYFASVLNSAVYRLDPVSATVTRIAGTGLNVFSGDGGPAVSAGLEAPSGLAVDAAGNLYIADGLRIRRVDHASGIISTVAGNGLAEFSGDGGPATSASLSGAFGVAVDAAGNLYIADSMNLRVRRVDQASGNISTVAGDGTFEFNGDGGPATSAGFYPVGIAVDAGGNLYIADSNSQRVRRVDPSGIISTVAGTGLQGFNGDGVAATSAQLSNPAGVTLDADGNLIIVDEGNARIRRVDHTSGLISTVAGTDFHGFSGDGGPATSAKLLNPSGVALDGAGNLFIADRFNSRIRRVDHPSGFIATVAGNGTPAFSGDGGAAIDASLYSPSGVAVDGGGNLYIADTVNAAVRRVDPNGSISTVAGSGTTFADGGPATGARLGFPVAVAVDAAGNLYIADYADARIRRVDPTGKISTLAGSGIVGFNGDRPLATEAHLSNLYGVAVDAAGNVYIADTSNQRIRRVDPDGRITTIAGDGTEDFTGDGGPASDATLSFPMGVAVDGAGNLYIADSMNSRIRRIDHATGIISTVAGDGSLGFGGDGGPATSASLGVPTGVALDADGSLYIADLGNQRIRRVDPSGQISTVAGSGIQGFSGDGGPATSASLSSPWSVAVDGAGHLYIADVSNHRVRRVTESTPPHVSANISGTLGAAGWYTSDVAVTWTVTDAESTISDQTGCGASSVTSDTSGVTFTCTATSTGGASTESVTIRRDATAPTVSVTIPAGGSYTQGAAVNASYACTDAHSGIAQCAGPVASGAALDTTALGPHTFTVNASDLAGNPTSVSTSYTVIAASAPPVVTPVLSGTLGSNGWYTSNVALTWTVTSDTPITSRTGCNPRTITANTSPAGRTFTCQATNAAGTTAQSVTIRRDVSPPKAKAHATPADNAAGWRKSPVTVFFTGRDGQSGVTGCSATVFLATEGSGQSASGTCTNGAGLVSAVANASGINIDLTAPVVSIAAPLDGAVYSRNSIVSASYACSDVLSGIAALGGCTGTVANGSPINTASRGNKTFVVKGRDAAGNPTTLTYHYRVQ